MFSNIKPTEFKASDVTDPDGGIKSVWPSGVTQGSVTLAKNRAKGTFTAALVINDGFPQLLAAYSGRLGELPEFLTFLRLVVPSNSDPLESIPDMTLIVNGNPLAAGSAEPDPPPVRDSDPVGDQVDDPTPKNWTT